MELQRVRLFLLVSLFLAGIALYGAWTREHPAPIHQENQTTTDKVKAGDIPQVLAGSLPPQQQVPSTLSKQSDLIAIDTDVLNVSIDLEGGDLVKAELKAYPQSLDNKEKGVMLLDKSPQRHYIAQTGLIGKDNLGPDSREAGRAHYTTTQKQYHLVKGEEGLNVELFWQNPKGIKVIKTYHFKPGSYLISVSYRIENPTTESWLGSFYGQIQRRYTKEKSSNMLLLGVQNYTGAAVFTPDKPYKKISFADMKKQPFQQQIEGGWAAMVEHYFLSSFIPQPDLENNYYTRVDDENLYNIGAITSVEVGAQSQSEIKGSFYVGPEIADVLKGISPGLQLTIDYGILWPISQLIFLVLKTIFQFVGNWGWSIILVTLLIKLLFYKLSASSYRSMGKMRALQPKIESLKEKHGSDKQQFSVALMELYREEKMNPLGGCLPILIQIPVFIALYYVLLESVELRQAPFMFWIQDLAARDPYYVLPLIMGATMFLQQRMNPAPPDPMQAKVMMFMPVLFTVLFLSFPAGLVLYWTANNLFSILQQWYITRTLHPVKKSGKKRHSS